MVQEIRRLLNLTNRAGTVHSRGVLTPLLWLTSIILSAFLVCLGLAGGDALATYFLGGLVTVLVVFDLFFFAYFAIRDPGRLQSESYQLRSQELQILSKHEGVITNPGAPRPLEAPGRKEGGEQLNE